MRVRRILPALSALSLVLARGHISARQNDSVCAADYTYFCCACDPVQIDANCGCFTDPCDPPGGFYETEECCASNPDGSTIWSSCYDPHPPPPPPPDPGNACAEGQNLECCEGDPNKDPEDPDGAPYCVATRNECTPGTQYYDAFCCDKYEDGNVDFFSCKSVPNNGAKPTNGSSSA